MNLDDFFSTANRATSQDELIQLFLCEGVRKLRTDLAVYFKYVESKRSLIAESAIGLEANYIDGVGLDLQALEPGFYSDQLLEPWRLSSLQNFVNEGLCRKDALILPLLNGNLPQGVFVFATNDNQNLAGHENQDSYGTAAYEMQLAQKFANQRCHVLSLQEKLARTSIYDLDCEALNAGYFRQKLEQEVSRARRIKKPVSLVFISVDRFYDLTLEVPPETVRHFVKSIAEILHKLTRTNDLVGRIARDLFVVCLPHTSQSGAMIVAERMRRIFVTSKFKAILGSVGKVSVQVSVSEYPSLSDGAEELLRSAERALIEVKKQGADHVGVANTPPRFTPDFLVNNERNTPPVAR